MIKKVLIIPLLSYPLLATSLPKLIEIALHKSTVVQKSQLDIEYAKVQSDIGRAEQLGSIDLVASYTKFNLPRTLAPLTPVTMKDPISAGNVATTKDLFGTGVSYSVPLFTGFAHTKQTQIDNISLEMARAKESLTKEQLVYNIRSIYLSILSAQELYQAQKRYIDTLTTLKEQIQLKVELGKKARIDLLKSRSNLQANITYLDSIRANITIAKASLASIVGVDSIDEVSSIGVRVEAPTLLVEKLQRDNSHLNKIKIANLNLKKSNRVIEKSQSTLLPQLSLNSYYGYNYGYNDSSNPNSGEFQDEQNWQIALNAKWTIYDFGKRDANIQKAKIGYMKSKLDSRQTTLDLTKSFIEGVAKLEQYYATYKSNQKQLELTRQSEEIERSRYENSASTLNDLLYASSQRAIAQAKLIESRYNYQAGIYYIEYLQERGVK